MLQQIRVPALASSLAFVQLVSPAFAADSPMTAAGMPLTELTAVRLSDGAAAPALDGRVTDEAWLKVEPYATFTQTDPIEGAPASERTEVRVLFDKSNIYIGVDLLRSEPSKIIVNQSRRDADLTETDAIILVLDTFNDNQNAFVFGTNPLGIEYDGQVSGEGQTSGNVQNAVGHRRLAARHDRIVQPELGRRLAREVRDHRTRLGNRDRDSVQDAALSNRHDRTWGFNVKRNIRRKNEQVYPRAGAARLRRVPRLVGGEAERAGPAAAPRPQADAVRAGGRQQGLHRHDQAGDAQGQS